MTEDHKPTDMGEYRRIMESGGVVVNGRINGILNLSRAIGDFNYKQCLNHDKEGQIIIPHPDIVSKVI